MASFEGGSRNPIPRWDSSASQFQRYRDEIRVFRLAENLEQSYSIAARLVSALSGPAKRVGLSLSDRELMPEYADYAAAEAEIQAGRQPPKLSKAEANDLAIKTLLSKLEKTLQPMRSQERGTRLEDFFVHRKHCRKKGMRIAEYNILWEESLERLREVDITVDTWGDLLGWLYLRGAGLSQDRYERVLCVVPPDDTSPMLSVPRVGLRSTTSLGVYTQNSFGSIFVLLGTIRKTQSCCWGQYERHSPEPHTQKPTKFVQKHNKAKMRARSCALFVLSVLNDGHACFSTFWDVVPESGEAGFQIKNSVAMHGGCSCERSHKLTMMVSTQYPTLM